MNMLRIFGLSIKDALAPNVLWITLISFVGTILFFVGLI